MNLTAGQVADVIAEIEEIARRLRALEPAIRLRAVPTGRDGYPPTSGPGVGGGHGGDPVGSVVVLRLDHPVDDVLIRAHRRLVINLHRARRLLEQAEAAGRQALPPATVRREDGCASCARIGQWSPIWRTRRCRWCSDWVYSHAGEDPPAEILRAHHEGRRITTRLVETISTRRRR